MINVHMGGKMGDLIYCLPVLRAMSRIHQQKIRLITSGLCWQLVPLLWEQPYFGMVDVDDTRPYEIKDYVMRNWDFFKGGEGFNLSLQPKMLTMKEPTWTNIYMSMCGVEELRAEDCMALPSLVNHRRWHYGMKVTINDEPQTLAKTYIVAPEVETLESASLSTWLAVMGTLAEHGRVLIVGRGTAIDWVLEYMASGRDGAHRLMDLRGLTTVPSLARLIAEATGFIGAHSFPWHLARHCEVPAVCVQRWMPTLFRCKVIDTPSVWVEPEAWELGVNAIVHPDTIKPGGCV